MLSCLQHLALLQLIFTATICPVSGQSDLAKLLDLIDQEETSSLAEIKQLRERNSSNSLLAPLFDFGYGLSAIHLRRPQEAVEVLEPFVDKRPQVYQARLLLIRAYIDLDQLDKVVLHAEKLLASFPAEQNSAERVAKHVGTLVGYLNFARPDCQDEWRERLEKAAENKIPQSLSGKYRESMTLVETRVAKIQEEIKRAFEKAGLQSDSKIASNISEAEALRGKAEEEAAELQNREKQREEKFQQMKLEMRNLQQQFDNLTIGIDRLDREVENQRQQQRALEKKVTQEDKNGKKTVSTEITNRPRYSQLGREIADKEVLKNQLQRDRARLMNDFQQLQNRATGLLNQQQLDELFSTHKMNQLGKSANLKEKKAKRESDSKGKDVPAARGWNNKLKSYSTYEPLDIASNKEFLYSIAKRFL